MISEKPSQNADGMLENGMQMEATFQSSRIKIPPRPIPGQKVQNCVLLVKLQILFYILTTFCFVISRQIVRNSWKFSVSNFSWHFPSFLWPLHNVPPQTKKSRSRYPRRDCWQTDVQLKLTVHIRNKCTLEPQNFHWQYLRAHNFCFKSIQLIK